MVLKITAHVIVIAPGGLPGRIVRGMEQKTRVFDSACGKKERIAFDPVGVAVGVDDAHGFDTAAGSAKARGGVGGKHHQVGIGLNLAGEELGEVGDTHPAGEKNFKVRTEIGTLHGYFAPHVFVADHFGRDAEVEVGWLVVGRDLVVADRPL